MLARNFSYSMLNMSDCMRKIKYYIDRVEVEYGPAANRGSKIHKMLELYLENREEEPLTVEMYEEEHRVSYDELVVFNVAKQKLKLLEVEPGIHSSEKKMVTERLLVDTPVTGIFDLLLQDGTIFDWKFPNKAWDDWKLNDYTQKQTWLYMWMTRELLDFQPKQFKFYVVNFAAPEQPQEFTIPYDEQKVDQEFHHWWNLMQKIEGATKLDMWDVNPDVRRCRWCNYKRICDRSMA